MILKMFTVYDSKAEAYMTPFFLNTIGQAIRSFSDTCNDKSHPFNLHPGDYTLFESGTYDNSTAQCVPALTLKSLGTALEHKTQLDLLDQKQLVED